MKERRDDLPRGPALPEVALAILRSVPIPALVVDPGARIVHANGPAGVRFDSGEGGNSLLGRMVGEAIGCVNSDGPGGCGHQGPCPGCSLRGMVDAALAGQPARRSPALVRVHDASWQLRDALVLVSATALSLDGATFAVVWVEEPETAPRPAEPGDPAPSPVAELGMQLVAARALLDAVPVALLVQDREGRHTLANRVAGEMLGRPPAEILGRTSEELFAPEVVAVHRSEEARARSGEPAPESEEEFRGREAPGRTVVACRSLTRSAGGGPLLVSTFTDISELARARQALAESERRHRLLSDNVHDVIWIMDATTERFTYVSPSITRLRGLTVAEALAEPLEQSLTAASLAKVRAHQQRSDGGGRAPGDATCDVYQQPCKDGSIKQVEITTTAIRNAAGQVVEVLGVSRDVTARMDAEAALQASGAQLRQAQKMEAIGRLAGGVAHDFNNILSVVLTSASFALEVAPRVGTLREDLEEIRLAGERAQGLTRQLLAFSRRQVLEPQILDLNELLRNLERMLRRLIGEDVLLRTVLQPGLGRIEADPGQLEQVILNLVVNARDAMPRGGKLALETAEVELDAAHASTHIGVRPGHYVRLTVSDTGSGMDPATLSRIFEPFFTTKEQGKGTGLGLSTVYGIVRQSGGSVWAYSEPGRGSTFKVYLPRVGGAPGPALAGEARSSLAAHPGETVLVVEDSEPVRRAAVRTLGLLGYRVLSAGSLAEAIGELLSEGGPIHLLLADVIMPDGSGPEVARAVAARLPGIRVLYMSGYTDEAVAHHGILLPGVRLLQKPFAPEALGRRVRELLDEPART